MYRSGLDGLTEQLRALEAQKLRLESDLAGMKRIRFPQRVARATVALLVLSGVAFVSSFLGYRHAVIEIEKAAFQDALVLRLRADRCNERLREALASGTRSVPEEVRLFLSGPVQAPP
jgi:hypothetical protein